MQYIYVYTIYAICIVYVIIFSTQLIKLNIDIKLGK